MALGNGIIISLYFFTWTAPCVYAIRPATSFQVVIPFITLYFAHVRPLTLVVSSGGHLSPVLVNVLFWEPEI